MLAAYKRHKYILLSITTINVLLDLVHVCQHTSIKYIKLRRAGKILTFAICNALADLNLSTG